jgi:hypothetical protein
MSPKGELGKTLDDDNSNSIGVVQPRNYWGHKLKPLKPQSPLEDERTANGILLLIVNSI